MENYPLYYNECSFCKYLGRYVQGEKTYDLYYCLKIVPKPLLRIQWADVEFSEMLPDKTYVEEHPDDPFSEAYRRAEKQNLRLFNHYSTKEITNAVGGGISGPYIRNWLQVRGIIPTKFSGDNYIPEDVFQTILQYYEEKRSRRADKKEYRKFRASVYSFTEAAKVAGVSRQSLYTLYNSGLIDTVEYEGKSTSFLGEQTVEWVKSYYASKKGEEVVHG